MNAQTKLIFTFNGGSFYRGTAGWSETYFMQVTGYAQAQTQLQALQADRIKLLCPDCECIGGTISDSDVKQDSYPSGLTAQPGIYTATPVPSTYNPDLAYRYLWHAGAVKRGNRWLRCLPDNQVSATGQLSLTADFTTALQAYNTLILTTVFLATKNKGAAAPPFYTLTPYTSPVGVSLENRKIGRPFSLRRGRVLVA
jgi:hypothetical protein